MPLLKKSTLICSSLFLINSFIAGCSSTTEKMVIAPEIYTNKTNQYQQKSAHIEVDDLRNKIHIIEILKEDQAAELISSNQNIAEIIKPALIKAFTQNGLTINSQSENQLTLIVNNAVITVKQALVKYSASNVITLTARVQSGEQTLTKTYNSKGQSEGVLKADIAVLERDFNQQLAKLLLQIVNDSEIQQFIQ